jgi:hypothetical protein
MRIIKSIVTEKRSRFLSTEGIICEADHKRFVNSITTHTYCFLTKRKFLFILNPNKICYSDNQMP